jgi:type II secretory pathway pseudopilin PulG
LVEVVVSIALIGIGLVVVLGAFGQLTSTDFKARQRETMQRLAALKYDELMGTGETQGASTSGNFEELGYAGYTWEAQVEATGTENLESLRVTVNRDGEAEGASASVEGLLYRAPLTAEGNP